MKLLGLLVHQLLLPQLHVACTMCRLGWGNVEKGRLLLISSNQLPRNSINRFPEIYCGTQQLFLETLIDIRNRKHKRQSQSSFKHSFENDLVPNCKFINQRLLFFLKISTKEKRNKHSNHVNQTSTTNICILWSCTILISSSDIYLRTMQWNLIHSIESRHWSIHVIFYIISQFPTSWYL